MRGALLAAALTVALGAPARADHVRLAGTGLVDPSVSTPPNDGDVAPMRGTRDVEPAGETDNTFIGGHWTDPPPPQRTPKPARRPPPQLPPKSDVQAPPRPQRLPGEGVLPPADDAATSDLALQSLDTPGEPRSLTVVVKEDVAFAPADISRTTAKPAPVSKKLGSSKESLPDLPAVPVHEAKPAAAKDVQLEDVSLAHDAIPDLIALLKTGSPRQRERAADELGRRGPEAKPAVSALIAALKGPDRLKASAALALGDIGGDAKGLEKLLRPLLKSKSADVRTSAETALQRLGVEE